MSRAATGDYGKGRGDKAVADMKARLAAMRANEPDSKKIFDELWQRNHEAVTGDGYTYEYAEA